MNEVETRNYQILKTLATGSTAVLYKAIQTSLDRPVVIKRLHAHLTSDPNFTRRFELEAKSAASLDHENIVRIIDFGSSQDNYYIVMEFISGSSLKEVQSEWGAFGEELTLLIAHEICMGLDHAHQNGIVHRDIKPANIMITNEGQVKITDFGLAKLHQSQTQQTVANTLLGTPLYMSPEQTIGDNIDGRSDLFSLGTICYEMVTGTQPFKGENYAAVIQNILKTTPPPPSKLGKEIDQDAEMIIMKALSHEPGKRYRTALEMARAIEAHLGQERILAVRDKLRRLISGEGTPESAKPKKGAKKRATRKRYLPLGIAASIFITAVIFFSLDPNRLETLKRQFKATRARDPLPAPTEERAAGSDEMMSSGMGMQPLQTDLSVYENNGFDSLTDGGAANAVLESLLTSADTLKLDIPREHAADEPQVQTPPGDGQPTQTVEIATSTKEPAQSAKPAVRTGFLDISVEPEAEIMIDGNHVTFGSRTGTMEIKAGRHELTCRKEGYKNYHETVLIHRGELSRRRILLQQESGLLQFNTIAGAQIYIDGVFKGTTPLANPIEVPVGSHKVELRKAGYTRWTNVVFIPSDESLSLNIRLVPR